MSLTPEFIRNALCRVIDRDAGLDVVAAGMISGLVIREDKVGFVITIDPKDKERKAYLREACEEVVKALPGVASVTVVLTAQNAEPIPAKPETGYTQPRERAVWNQTPLEHVRKIIAVASGKGGVGKSTTAVNLALTLAASGKRIGLLDADIYGPSIPRMMGLPETQPEIVGGKMMPPENFNVRCMSMGFITGSEAAILRGPMISKTLQQMLRFTAWGDVNTPLDALIVDMPPGTGDVHLSLGQQVPLSGAVIVTTPQDVATIDARKCLITFQKMGVPVLGVIENMSYFMDATGAALYLFGKGGGKRLADEMGVPFLGEIPIDPAIGTSADQGHRYNGNYRSAYEHIIEHLH